MNTQITKNENTVSFKYFNPVSKSFDVYYINKESLAATLVTKDGNVIIATDNSMKQVIYFHDREFATEFAESLMILADASPVMVKSFLDGIFFIRHNSCPMVICKHQGDYFNLIITIKGHDQNSKHGLFVQKVRVQTEKQAEYLINQLT